MNSGDVDCLCSFGDTDIHHIKGFEKVPTALSCGYDIQFVMFRGVAGAPGMSDEALAYWVDIFQKVSEDPAWTKDYLGAKGLTPAFIVGDELQTFLKNQYDISLCARPKKMWRRLTGNQSHCTSCISGKRGSARDSPARSIRSTAL